MSTRDDITFTPDPRTQTLGTTLTAFLGGADIDPDKEMTLEVIAPGPPGPTTRRLSSRRPPRGSFHAPFAGDYEVTFRADGKEVGSTTLTFDPHPPGEDEEDEEKKQPRRSGRSKDEG